MTEKTKAAALKLCRKKAEGDDALGMFSDHEGDESSSTWHWFTQSPEELTAHVRREEELHLQQISIIRRLLRLKRRDPN